MDNKIDIYNAIRKQIISMERKPGATLDEKSLVKEFGGSRTPVREALIKLGAEGFVETRRNRGATVADLDLNTLKSIFEARSFIEKAVTRLACKRRTEDNLIKMQHHKAAFSAALSLKNVGVMAEANTLFNLEMAASTQNKYLHDCYRRILADHERVAQLWYQHNIDSGNQAANEAIEAQHHDLYEAISSKDGQKADNICARYSDQCKDGLFQILSSGEQAIEDIEFSDE